MTRGRRRTKRAPLIPFGVQRPSFIVASPASDTTIDIFWQNVVGETGYEVEISLDGVNFSFLASTAENIAFTQATGLNGNTIYYFRVRAFAGTTTGPYSSVAITTTYDTDAWTALVGMGAETDFLEVQGINDAVVYAKEQGVWDDLECLMFFSPQDYNWALYDVKRNIFVNDPTSAAYEYYGFYFNGSTYLDTVFNPDTDSTAAAPDEFVELAALVPDLQNSGNVFWGISDNFATVEYAYKFGQEGGGSPFGVGQMGVDSSEPIYDAKEMYVETPLMYAYGSTVEIAQGFVWQEYSATYTIGGSQNFTSFPVGNIYLGAKNDAGSGAVDFSEGNIWFFCRSGTPNAGIVETIAEIKNKYNAQIGRT